LAGGRASARLPTDHRGC